MTHFFKIFYNILQKRQNVASLCRHTKKQQRKAIRLSFIFDIKCIDLKQNPRLQRQKTYSIFKEKS